MTEHGAVRMKAKHRAEPAIACHDSELELVRFMLLQNGSVDTYEDLFRRSGSESVDERATVNSSIIAHITRAEND